MKNLKAQKKHLLDFKPATLYFPMFEQITVVIFEVKKSLTGHGFLKM
ncbi:MAG TPA: hypothetical protein PLR73_04345 [Acetivibrio sp.]|nr:hypothetical protein [Acetivibrio sp.]